MQSLGDFFQKKLASFPPFPEVSLSSQWRDHVNCVSTWASTTLDTASTYMPYCFPGTCRAKSQLPTWQTKPVAMLMEVKQSEKIPTKSVFQLVYFDGNFSASSPYSIPKAAQSGMLPEVHIRPQYDETFPKKKGYNLPLAPLLAMKIDC